MRQLWAVALGRQTRAALDTQHSEVEMGERWVRDGREGSGLCVRHLSRRRSRHALVRPLNGDVGAGVRLDLVDGCALLSNQEVDLRSVGNIDDL